MTALLRPWRLLFLRGIDFCEFLFLRAKICKAFCDQLREEKESYQHFICFENVK